MESSFLSFVEVEFHFLFADAFGTQQIPVLFADIQPF